MEDRLHGNPLAVATLANVCALPLDIPRLQGMEDAALLIGALQSSFSVSFVCLFFCFYRIPFL